MMKYELEIIAFDIQSCLEIEKCGATRIELCANPLEGGTTPSAGMIKAARSACFIQLFPIIRPRGGDFLYSPAEFEAMGEDIQLCKSIGCDGVVMGMLTSKGEVDQKRCAQLIKAAGSMEVTFHRAFDRVQDPFEAMESIISLGCTRILTSGLHPHASEGALLIRELVERAGTRIQIMVGSGVRSDNIRSLASSTTATCFHSSARIDNSSAMQYSNSDMHEALKHATVDPMEVRRIKQVLDNYFSPS